MTYGTPASIDPTGDENFNLGEVYGTGFTMLLPYLEQSGLSGIYNPLKPWYLQSPQLISTVVPVLICPSNSKDNPATDPYLMGTIFNRFQNETGLTLNWGTLGYGVTDYLFCKGVTDTWCFTPYLVADWPTVVQNKGQVKQLIGKIERGMFDMSVPREAPHWGRSFACRDSMIGDGLSNTLAMGEGAEGSNWPMCLNSGLPGQGCTMADVKMDPNNPNSPVPSYQYWWGAPLKGHGADGPLGGILGCTLEPMNKNPVTQTGIRPNDTYAAHCRASVDWTGDGLVTGLDRTSNFRSDHSGGCIFVYADGSAHFLQQSMDIAIYRGSVDDRWQ